MASIHDIITNTDNGSESLLLMKADLSSAETLFKPLSDAGFSDFNWVGSGTNAFFVSPADNDKVVFRVSSEWANRRSDTPFFLCSPYEHEGKVSDATVKVEMLLAGQKEVPDAKKMTLITEMKKAGWKTENIPNPEGFFRDVIMVPLRTAENRTELTPIISDPSAITHYLMNANPDGSWNTCSSSYPTLQDQERTYAAVIAQDERLQKLIPEPVKFSFMPTVLVQQQQQQQQEQQEGAWKR